MSYKKLEPFFYKSPPEDLKKLFSNYACVSIILKPNTQGFDIAFIRRARNPKDPWAGHVAFPGGRREDFDKDDLDTAIRETVEEVGWQLTSKNFLGFLSDLRAVNKTGFLEFFLRPMVFYVENELPLNLFASAEVEEVFWISTNHLRDVKNRTSITVPQRGLDMPGIQLPTGDILWGLTYRITQELILKINNLKL